MPKLLELFFPVFDFCLYVLIFEVAQLGGITFFGKCTIIYRESASCQHSLASTLRFRHNFFSLNRPYSITKLFYFVQYKRLRIYQEQITFHCDSLLEWKSILPNFSNSFESETNNYDKPTPRFIITNTNNWLLFSKLIGKLAWVQIRTSEKNVII